jgi:hypothetical protein
MNEEQPTRADLLLKPHEAATYLQVTVDALKLWRTRKYRAGPPFVKIGDLPRSRVRYPLRDLQQWVSEHTIRI